MAYSAEIERVILLLAELCVSFNTPLLSFKAGGSSVAAFCLQKSRKTKLHTHLFYYALNCL